MTRILILLLLFPFAALADTAEGIKHYRAENFEQAHKAFFAAAQTDDPDALYWLGIMYQKGQFVEQHDLTALVNFEKAGHLGHVKAMRETIRYYLNGWGTIPDRARAAFWLKLSADKDPQYAAQFKRFYAKLTTFERFEYKSRMEKYQK